MSTPSSTSRLTLRGWFRLIAVGLLLVVLVGVSRLVSLEWDRFTQARRSLQAVHQLRVALVAAEMVSRERGPTNGVLGAPTVGDATLSERLQRARSRTDEALAAYQRELADPSQDLRYQRARSDAVALLMGLQRARAQVDRHARLPRAQRPDAGIRDSVRAMVDLVPRLASAITLFADEAQRADARIASPVWSARMAAELREYAGLLGSLFTPALTRQQPFTEEERVSIERVKGRIEGLHHLLSLRVEQSNPSDAVMSAHAAVEQSYFGHAGQLLGEVQAAGRSHGRYGLTAADFAALYVPDMDAIVALRDALLDDAEQRGIEAREHALRALTWLGALTTIVLTLVLAMLHLTRQRIVVPLSQAASVLHAMGRGDLSRPLPQPRAQDEIAAVIGGIEALRQQSHARAELEAERDKLIETLREQSTTDFLTALPNRRAFFEAAQAELARARRHGFGLVLLLMDVDHFKRVNDSLGHAVGDQALVEVAGVLRQSMRQGDLAARLGGEEFVVLLSHCSPEDGLAFAERLREAVQAQSISVGEGLPPLRLTVSIGLSDTSHQGHELGALMARADAAMYRAKHTGRNRTERAVDLDQAG